MKIMQNIMNDLFYSAKTESSTSLATASGALEQVIDGNTSDAVTGSETEALLSEVDSEIIEALTEDQNLSPEQKKQIEVLIKDPQLTKKEKIEAISLMIRKQLPLTKEIMRAIHEGLTKPILPVDVQKALEGTPNSLDIIPELLQNLVDTLLTPNITNPFQGAVIETLFEQSSVNILVSQHQRGAEEDVFQIIEALFEQTEPMKGNNHYNLQEDSLKSIGPFESLEQMAIGDTSTRMDHDEMDATEIEGQLLSLIHALAIQPQVSESMESDEESGKGKIFLRQEIKDAMKAARVEFQGFKETSLRQLKSVEEPLSDGNRQLVIQKTIEAVDRVLMKSDIPLYTSMKMEKQLLVLSSDLQEVKKLVNQGKWSEAKEGIKTIIKSLEQMDYKPSAKKMIYQSGFINSSLQKELGRLQTKGLDLTSVLGKQLTTFSQLKASPRMVLEHLRNLGYNQAAEQQEGKSTLHSLSNRKQKSIYQVIETLAQDGLSKDAKDKAQEWPKIISESIGAHRLLNKLEEGGSKQSMDLNIPYRIHDEIKEIKVHIDARKQNELLDWENFQMFFVLETKRLGQVGIGVYTVDRKLSLTFKGENKRVLGQLNPIAEQLKKSLVGVGYQLVGIQYGLLNESKKDIVEEKRESAIQNNAKSQKGVDIKV